MTGGSILLGALVGKTDVLNVACRRCGRAGRYSVGKLIERHGPEYPLTILLGELSADCPKKEAATIYDVCGIYCPGLAAVFGIPSGSICK
jgi:hypothetical protein